jgi:hypothetical protein
VDPRVPLVPKQWVEAEEGRHDPPRAAPGFVELPEALHRGVLPHCHGTAVPVLRRDVARLLTDDAGKDDIAPLRRKVEESRLARLDQAGGLHVSAQKVNVAEAALSEQCIPSGRIDLAEPCRDPGSLDIHGVFDRRKLGLYERGKRPEDDLEVEERRAVLPIRDVLLDPLQAEIFDPEPCAVFDRLGKCTITESTSRSHFEAGFELAGTARNDAVRPTVRSALRASGFGLLSTRLPVKSDRNASILLDILHLAVACLHAVLPLAARVEVARLNTRGSVDSARRRH